MGGAAGGESCTSPPPPPGAMIRGTGGGGDAGGSCSSWGVVSGSTGVGGGGLRGAAGPREAVATGGGTSASFTGSPFLTAANMVSRVCSNNGGRPGSTVVWTSADRQSTCNQGGGSAVPLPSSVTLRTVVQTVEGSQRTIMTRRGHHRKSCHPPSGPGRTSWPWPPPLLTWRCVQPSCTWPPWSPGCAGGCRAPPRRPSEHGLEIICTLTRLT